MDCLRATSAKVYAPPAHGPTLKAGWWYMSQHSHRIFRIVGRRDQRICAVVGSHDSPLYTGCVFVDSGSKMVVLRRVDGGFDVDTVCARPPFYAPQPQPQKSSARDHDPLDWEAWFPAPMPKQLTGLPLKRT